jgi:hypothetical protein
MAPQIRLGARQITDLVQIRDLPPEVLSNLAARLQAANPLRADELLGEIKAALGAEQTGVADRIMRPLLGLQSMIRHKRIGPEEAVKAVREALQSADPKWTDAELRRWDALEQDFQALISSPAVRRVSVTLELTYEYENLLQSARIVTDIRPMFNEDVSAIEGAVISHTLRVRYDSAEGDHSLSLAMDQNDIKDLQRQCERALQKATAAQRLMTENAKVKTVISGAGDTDDA